MLKISSFKSIIVAFLLLAFGLMACSPDEKEDEPKYEPTVESPGQQKAGFTSNIVETPGFEGWREYRDEFLMVYCPPEDRLIERVPDISKKIKEVTMENAVRLGVQIPQPLVFFLYNNTTEIQEKTDCENTCVKGNVIHYMIFTPLGEPIMIRLLSDFDRDGTPYKFVYEGLVTFLNYSGKNYIEMAYIDLVNDSLTSFSTMLDNEEYLAVDSARRIVHAASFVNFLIDHPWSPDKILELYKRQDPIRDALEDVFGVPAADLEKDWIEYLKVKSGLHREYLYDQ